MLALLIVTLLTGGAQSGASVIDSLTSADLEREGIRVVLLAGPDAMTSDAFARSLVDAEGLVPSYGPSISERTLDNGLAYKAAGAGDGRSVVAFYRADLSGPTTACRITAPRLELSDARYVATRWCASRFDVALPVEPQLPVRGN